MSSTEYNPSYFSGKTKEPFTSGRWPAPAACAAFPVHASPSAGPAAAPHTGTAQVPRLSPGKAAMGSGKSALGLGPPGCGSSHQFGTAGSSHGRWGRPWWVQALQYRTHGFACGLENRTRHPALRVSGHPCTPPSTHSTLQEGGETGLLGAQREEGLEPCPARPDGNSRALQSQPQPCTHTGSHPVPSLG